MYVTMERTLLSNSRSSKMKESWEREDYHKFDKDYPYGYPWPPRYYTCSFCQREFKSAQALGGHMNIHRKDRARLRDLSPDQNPNPNPNLNSKHNPNPMISSSTPSSCPTNIYAQQYSLVSLSLSSIPPSRRLDSDDGDDYHSQQVGKCKKISSFDNDLDYDLNHDQKVRVLERSTTSTKEVVRLDLELCLGDAKEEDDGLDLELRLGI